MAKPILNERTIADYMKRNKCSREDAIDLIKYDIAIESGEDTEYDLSEEQEQVVKTMMRKVDHAKQDGKVKRERKPNELKEAIIAELAEFLREDAQGQVYEDVEVTNISRMIAFTVGEKKFELTLIEKRPPKNK
jgi:fatty acid-binding protein DegV